MPGKFGPKPGNSAVPSTDLGNIIKNQERVIEELMLNILTILNIKIENKEVGEVA